MRRPTPIPPEPGQESVWDYPRPPALERVHTLVEAELAGHPVCVTRSAFRVLETSHPPTYYIPRGDVIASLVPAGGGSVCEWKGAAEYWDVVVEGAVAPRAAWSYPAPTRPFEAIAGHVSFYPALIDCRVDGVVVVPQPGGFYGGWVTPEIVGPFKGGPGTFGW